MKRLSILNVGLTLMVVLSGAAESTAANPVSLDALVSDVLEHNPELNFYRAEIAFAGHQLELLTGVALSIMDRPAKEETK